MKYHAFYENTYFSRTRGRSKLIATVDTFEEAKTQCEKHASDLYGPIDSENSTVQINWFDKEGQSTGNPSVVIDEGEPIKYDDNYLVVVDSEYNRNWIRDELDDQVLFRRGEKTPCDRVRDVDLGRK